VARESLAGSLEFALVLHIDLLLGEAHEDLLQRRLTDCDVCGKGRERGRERERESGG
jgi:hypothetical protein